MQCKLGQMGLQMYCSVLLRRTTDVNCSHILFVSTSLNIRYVIVQRCFKTKYSNFYGFYVLSWANFCMMSRF